MKTDAVSNKSDILRRASLAAVTKSIAQAN